MTGKEKVKRAIARWSFFISYGSFVAWVVALIEHSSKWVSLSFFCSFVLFGLLMFFIGRTLPMEVKTS